jgi:hypothetical protein
VKGRGIFVLVVAALGGCDSSEAPAWRHETLWADGDDRVEIDKQEEQATRELMVSYRVRLVRKGAAAPLLDGSAPNKSFRAQAGRLADGRVAVLADTFACAAGAAGQAVCVDLGDVVDGRSPRSCEYVVKASASCRSGLLPQEEAAGAVLRWVAAQPDAPQKMRIAAVFALARGGDVPDAVSKPAEPAAGKREDDADLLFDGAVARARGDARRIDALRRALAEGSQHKRVAVARSCVPELAADVEKVRQDLATSRPTFAADLAAAQKECAALPRPPR